MTAPEMADSQPGRLLAPPPVPSTPVPPAAGPPVVVPGRRWTERASRSLSYLDRRPGLAVAALSGLALALRAPYLTRAFWIDEGISIGIASHPLAQLPGLLREDGSPPLFYVILHLWIRLFGTSEPATHALPLLISLVTVPVGYWAGRSTFDRRAGLALAALMATNPFLNWFATETRMYTLVVLLATVALTLAVRAGRQHRRRDVMGSAAAFTALLYTHDWAIYLTAATAVVFWWWAWRSRDRRLALGVTWTGLGVFLLWLPWASDFFYQAGNTAAPWAVRPAVGDFFADPATALAGTLGFVVVPAVLVTSWWARRRVPRPERRRADLLAAVALGTSLLGFVGAQIDPSWTVRYLAVLVAPYLMAAAGLLAGSRFGRTVIAIACATLAGWAVIGVVIPNPNGRYAKDNMAAIAAGARSHLSPGDLVVLTQTEQLAVAAHYLPAGLQFVVPTGPVADPRVVDWRNIVSRLQAADPCVAVAPEIDSLPVGAMVLEIDPVRRVGATGTPWSRAVNDQVVAVDDLITRDVALAPVASITSGLRPKPYAAVDAMLYRKVSTARACA